MRALTLLTLLIALYGPPVAAQMACGVHADWALKLQQQYGETRRSSGMVNPTTLMELWASSEPPYTWTILQVYPNGRACLMAAGKNFQSDPPVTPGKDA